MMKWLLFVILLAITGCATVEPVASPRLEHVVLLWLNDSGNADHRQQIMEISKTFAEIPSVIDVRVGSMIPSDRSIVDSTFDVGIIVSVADEQGLEEYLVHPIHEAAKDNVLLPLVEKIQVFDFAE